MCCIESRIEELFAPVHEQVKTEVQMAIEVEDQVEEGTSSRHL